VHAHIDSGVVKTKEFNDLTEKQSDLRRKTHQTITKVTDDIGRRYTFNTAIAANMELLNELASFTDNSEQGHMVAQEALEAIIQMLSPIIPHVSSVMWAKLGHTQAIYQTSWPVVDAQALESDSIELIVQVNGKKRATIVVPTNADNKSIEEIALNDDNVQRFIENKEIIKKIIVPGRLVNIVVK